MISTSRQGQVREYAGFLISLPRYEAERKEEGGGGEGREEEASQKGRKKDAGEKLQSYMRRYFVIAYSCVTLRSSVHFHQENAKVLGWLSWAGLFP